MDMDISAYTSQITNSAVNKTGDNWSQNNYSKATDQELMDACKEFEAYLWEQVLSEMTKSVNFGIDEESSSSSMVGYFKEEAMKEIAGQITESTTSSLAQSLYEQMKRNYEV
jgi:flagellar protein FlgJ